MTTDIANMPTAEQISAMPSGPEMDAAVRDTLGLPKLGDVTPYSRSYLFAIAALETWREQHPKWVWTLNAGRQPDPEMEFYCSLYDPRVSGMHIDNEVFAPTLALAICRALLLAGREVRDAART